MLALPKRLSLRTTLTLAVSTITFVFVALLVTTGVAQASAGKLEVPARTILVIDSGTAGGSVESDLIVGKSDHLVRVNGQYLNLDLDAQSVKQTGWKISREPIDPESPIQIYNLAPIK